MIEKIKNIRISFDYGKLALFFSLMAMAFVGMSQNTPCAYAQAGACSVGENIIATERQIYWLLTILVILHFIYCCYAGYCIYVYTNSWMGIIIGLAMGFMLGKYSTRQWITPTKSYLKD